MANKEAENHKSGRFPSNTEPNLKNHAPHQCNTIQLPSGTTYKNYLERDGVLELEDASDNEDEAELEREGANSQGLTAAKMSPATDHQPLAGTLAVAKSYSTLLTPNYMPPTPFPEHLAKPKHDEKLSQFMEMFQKMNINIPLLDALQDMPGYIKFLKEAVTSKKKFGMFESIKLSEELVPYSNKSYH